MRYDKFTILFEDTSIEQNHLLLVNVGRIRAEKCRPHPHKTFIQTDAGESFVINMTLNAFLAQYFVQIDDDDAYIRIKFDHVIGDKPVHQQVPTGKITSGRKWK